MNAKIRRELDRRKRRIQYRLEKAPLKNLDKPVYTASNIRYDFAQRGRGIAHGGIGAFHLLARRIGLIDAIDDNLHLLKIHLPYHESDHVLNFAFNALCNGTCLQDIELRRTDRWDVIWTGFDVGLALAFSLTALAAWRRSPVSMIVRMPMAFNSASTPRDSARI